MVVPKIPKDSFDTGYPEVRNLYHQPIDNAGLSIFRVYQNGLHFIVFHYLLLLLC